MFNIFKKPSIKQITSTSSGDYLFVFGLGRDGKMYIWNSIQSKWLPHVNTAVNNQEALKK